MKCNPKDIIIAILVTYILCSTFKKREEFMLGKRTSNRIKCAAAAKMLYNDRACRYVMNDLAHVYRKHHYFR